ncbi:MAG: transglycosylase SLT domain-containing protein [Oceanospirillaceae bacterium]|nr:transglycosylase SLT domain-containing protein [Oceanospirillaceae bacterium]MCP5349476.1 transglycosylase SLT domain-containing protein [Oceanospirillaceae bacterium]
MRKLSGLLLLFTVICAHAKATDDDALFLQSEKALAAGQSQHFEETLERLKDYPLTPYLEANWIQRQFSKAPHALLQDFFNRYPDTPASNKLRNQWLDYLAQKQNWSGFAQYYVPSHSLNSQCLYVRALDATDQTTQAQRLGEALWLTGRSLPKSCDTVFRNWSKSGRLTDQLVWQRAVIAWNTRNKQLARYLAKQLNKTDAQDFRTYTDLWLSPEKLVSDKRARNLPSPALDILFERLAKTNPGSAHVLLADSSFSALLSPESLETSQNKLIYQSARNPMNDGYLWFQEARKAELLDQNLYETFLLSAIKDQNWPFYVFLFNSSDDSITTQARWLYWQGRALQFMNANAQDSLKYFRMAAEERDYYGFMAAQWLGKAPSMNHEPVQVPDSIMDSVRNNPGVLRALAFYRLNRITEARREWYSTSEKANDLERAALASIAGEQQWYDRAILTLAKAKNWNDLELRFPLLHRDTIEQVADKMRMDTRWIYAITRQESCFQADARSAVGATGLMQLMPATARMVSRQFQIPYKQQKLTEPDYNLQLGSRYLKTLLTQFNGNRVLATAAYNAGPGAVKRWLKNYDGPLDVWIEKIPYGETREYVQRVLTYGAIYGYRLGKQGPILDEDTLTAWSQPFSLHLSQYQQAINNEG